MEHKKRISKAWAYFTRKSGFMATCNLCSNDFSYRGSVSNLTKHIVRTHELVVDKKESRSDDDEDIIDSSFAPEETLDTQRYFDFTDVENILQCKICYKEVKNGPADELMKHVMAHEHGSDGTDAECETDTSKSRATRQPRSNVWNYFIRKPGMMAQCKLCAKDYSYRTSTSNLNKHFIRQHGINAVDTDHNSDDNSETSRVINERKFSTRRYFDVTDNLEMFCCKLCSKEVHGDTVANLIKHIVEEHGNFDDTDNENDDRPKSKLLVWLYFKPCTLTRIATCLICRESVSYQDTVSSLKEHLETNHPLVKFQGSEQSNRLLISADGDLYEVETVSTRINHDDDEKDPIEMDTVYLNDFEDNIPNEAIDKKNLTSFEKNDKLLSKVKRSISFTKRNDNAMYKMPKRPSFKRKRREMYNIKKEVDSSSSDDEFVKNKKNKPIDTHLDVFGQYVVSLLKKLPKRLSDQLQGDIVKQIITAKMINESGNNTKVTVSNGVTVPVTATDTIPVTECQSVTRSLPVIVCSSDGNIKTIHSCE